MNQIDMSQMPEGATHFNTTNKYWYKEIGSGMSGYWQYWKDGKWVNSRARMGTSIIALFPTVADAPNKHIVDAAEAKEKQGESLPTMEELMPIPAHITDPQAIAALEHVRERLYSTLVNATEASLQEEEHCEDCTCPECNEPMMVEVTGEELMQALQTEGGMEALIASKVGGQPEPKVDPLEAEFEVLLETIYAKVGQAPDAHAKQVMEATAAMVFMTMKDMGYSL